MKKILLAAGAYNILFGIFAVFFPMAFFQLSGMAAPQYLELWQCIGMIVGVYGIGYSIAAFNPIRHWVIIFVGLLGKILGPIGFVYAIAKGTFTTGAFWMIFFNDLIWWVPFCFIMWKVYRTPYEKDDTLIDMFSHNSLYGLDMFEASNGMTLKEMSEKWTVMVVFLRHFGCTFCKEMLDQVKDQNTNIEVRNVRLVLIHMAEYEEAESILENYHLDHIPHISDPEGILYKKFKLRRGTFTELMGFKVLFRFLKAGVLQKRSLELGPGNIYQMPGVFVIKDGQVCKKFIYESAADYPDLEKLIA